MSFVPPQTGDNMWRAVAVPHPCDAVSTLAGPDACLMCPVRDASLEWVKMRENLPVVIDVTSGDVTGHPLWLPDLTAWAFAHIY